MMSEKDGQWNKRVQFHYRINLSDETNTVTPSTVEDVPDGYKQGSDFSVTVADGKIDYCNGCNLDIDGLDRFINALNDSRPFMVETAG